jgi:hypothetical protein
MKNIIIISVALSLLLSCKQKSEEKQSANNGWARLNLKGRIKSITTNLYDTVRRYGEIQKGEMKRSELNIFNDNGKLIEETVLVGTLFDEYKTTYKYDDKGNEIETCNYDRDGSLIYKYLTKYDEKGNQVEMKGLGPDSSREIKTVFLLKGSHLERKITLPKRVYKYDDKGNQIEVKNYDAFESLKDRHTYKYDGKGNQNEDDIYNSEGILETKLIYRYDGHGNKIEMNSFNSDGSRRGKFTYKFDQEGNQIEEIEYKSDGLIDRKKAYKYEYDKKLNWIKMTEFKNDLLASVSERVIEYF